jgi:hypothetical protein
MARGHEFGPGSVCLHCGGTDVELMPFNQVQADWSVLPCTGNAYICRVARKIRARFPGFWFPYRNLGTAPPIRHPWEMHAGELAAVLHGIRFLGVYVPNEATDGLIRRIKEDPTVCPMLADAIEEACCTDAVLLAALRTT